MLHIVNELHTRHHAFQCLITRVLIFCPSPYSPEGCKLIAAARRIVLLYVRIIAARRIVLLYVRIITELPRPRGFDVSFPPRVAAPLGVADDLLPLWVVALPGVAEDSFLPLWVAALPGIAEDDFLPLWVAAPPG